MIFCYVRTKRRLAFNKKVERRPRATANIITVWGYTKTPRTRASILSRSVDRRLIFPTSVHYPTVSLCGITHTTSSKNDGRYYQYSVISTEPGMHNCTSNAVKSHITNVLYQETERLSRRLGIRNFLLPQLPTIHKINTGDFISSDEEISKYRRTSTSKTAQSPYLHGKTLLSWQSDPVAMYLH